MKVSILFVTLCGMAFASCIKNYTCECTTTTTFSGSAAMTQTSAEPVVGGKKFAEKECKSNEISNVTTYEDPATGQIDSSIVTSTCELK
jgi:hypothetical protein